MVVTVGASCAEWRVSEIYSIGKKGERMKIDILKGEGEKLEEDMHEVEEKGERVAKEEFLFQA